MTVAAEQTSRQSNFTSLRRRIVGQGALLLSGLALGQIFSFVRNAMLGYWLSKEDFGIAATITLALQLLETLSDLGADRLIVQADDADAPGLLAVSHATMLLRGCLTALALYLGAGPITEFFAVPHARAAFELAALVPLVKGGVHLEPRRRQRIYDNRASLAVEIVPQAVALLLTAPILTISASYDVVVSLALVQSAMTVITSHALARAPYRLGLERATLGRMIRFGWPIWLSAFPLLAVYQGDRLLIGRLFGMEALAGYTAAFMITMVPGLLAAKVANALLLPLLSDTRAAPQRFAVRYGQTSELTVLLAALYVTGFLMVGGPVLAFAFGPAYAGHEAIIGWLALMWALRMVQAVPGMALMAHGDTRPMLVAGIIRAFALLLAVEAVRSGLGMPGIAAAGCIGELASLAYVAGCTSHHNAGLAGLLLRRVALLAPVSACATYAAGNLAQDAVLGSLIPATVAMLCLVAFVAVAVLPGLRGQIASIVTRPRRPVEDAWALPPGPATDSAKP